MKSSKVNDILEMNDRVGERRIALVQAIMAVTVFTLHCITASRSAWETLSVWTIALCSLMAASALCRLFLSRSAKSTSLSLHFLTVIDGLLIFGLLLSYNSAYGLELAAVFKAPSFILLIVYTAVRLFRFDPTSIFVAAGTVLGGWLTLFLFAYFGATHVTTSYTEYLTSQKLMVGAVFEMALGYVIFVIILGVATSGARNFVARTAMVEELEVANRRAEESAREFEELFSSSAEGILIVDKNGNIEQANHALQQLFGFDARELIGRSAAVLMSEEYATALRAGITHYLEYGDSPLVGKTYESQGRSKDGKLIDIELSINEFSSSGEVRFAGFIRDISDRKQAERNELNAVARFQNAVDASLDAIIIIDEAGIISAFNPAAEEIFGFKHEEVVGCKLSELIIPKRYRDAHDKGMAHYMKTGEGPVLNSRIEIEGLNADGEEILLELAIREIDGENGRLFFGYARDIRDRKAAEQELISAKNEADYALEAKSRFLAMMSHEIRTPLNGVLGIVNLLEETKLTTEQAELLGVARDSGQLLLSIINNILDFSKLEVGKFNIEKHPFEFSTMMDSVVALVRPMAEEKGLSLNTRLNEKLENAYIGDADRIRQVLINLIWNAVKFTDEGSVDVSVSVGSNGALRFEVKDTGIGISREQMNTLFEEFVTLEDHRNSKMSGTGLGLVISKALVEAMGGEIGVHSEEKQGTSFWFEIALEKSEDQSCNEVRNQQVEDIDSKHLIGARVLVAEDNLTNQLITRSFLTRRGVRVDLANNGEEAVELASNGSYDLILMDISMPEMDGFTATKIIRESDRECANIPIIGFTAYTSREDQEEVLQRGMNDYVSKPFTKDQLLSAIVRNLEAVSPKSSEDDQSAHSVTDLERVFDLSVLRDLLDDHDQDIQAELISQFSKDVERFQQQAEQGLSNEDWVSIERASHGLKGSAGMFGAKKLSLVAEEVNNLCKSGAIADEPRLAIEMINLTSSVLKEMDGSAALWPSAIGEQAR